MSENWQEEIEQQGKHTKKSMDKSLVNIKKTLESRSAEVAPSLNVITFPWWPDDKRGAPNAFLRSALFAAIHGKDRVFMKRVELPSHNGIKIVFTGEQFNQTDLDIWEAIVQIAKQHPLGTAVSVTSYEILKMLGLRIGSSQYKQLYETITRLAGGVIHVTKEGKRKGYMSHLVVTALTEKSNDIDSEPPENYQIQLDKNLIHLFGKNEWTALGWEQRKKVRNKPLAQGLHAFYSSHQKPFPIKVETLHGLVGSHNEEMKGFKRNLKNALDELKKIDFLIDWQIEDDGLVHVKRSLLELTKK